jgi:DnaK suppressor protein
MSTTAIPKDTTAPGTANGWERFRLLLEIQRNDCVRQRESALAEAAISVPDPVTVSRAARLLHTPEDIEAALDRIANGSYGTCAHCGAAIPAERLELRPFARRCVGCEQQPR